MEYLNGDTVPAKRDGESWDDYKIRILNDKERFPNFSDQCNWTPEEIEEAFSKKITQATPVA